MNLQNENELIKSHLGLVVVQAAKFSTNSLSDFDDYICAGQIGLLKAIRKYDESLGFEFGTFATTCIRREIIREAKKSNKNKHIYSTGVLSGMEADEVGERWWEFLPDSLTEIELEALKLRFVENYKLQEIGNRYGYTKQWAGNILKSAMGKIKECYG